MFRKGAVLLIVAVVAAGVGSLAAEVTRGLPDSPIVTRASATTVPAEIIRKAIEGGYAEIEDVAGWLLRDNATTEEAGTRAVAVALAAGRSPKAASVQAHAAMLDRVRQAWSLAICVPRVFRIDTTNGFRPAPGSIAVDFGGPNSERMPGFVRVTERTPNVAGRDLRPIANLGGGALFGDGLEGVEEFAVALHNGTYKVTVLSTSRNSGRFAAAPLGYRIAINGERRLIGEAPSPTWLRHAELGGTGLAPLLVSGAASMRGGGITFKATVTDGTLRVAFSQKGGTGASLAGLLIEPVATPSQIHLFGEARGTDFPIDRCIAYQQQVDDVFDQLADVRGRITGPSSSAGGGGGGSSGGTEPPPVSSS
ncbi:MAG TPA: hypothetical protein VED46_04120 [Alphaproteobacteria bacterium]|nr:hypothetical protein [Alphaproteobacteria bacterium]